ncbi:MAG TPA: hypothetical protein VJ729_00330 [Nitrososphaeraceae archaeon]|nr:hypothetical protein [Nitrososphaeraceae archaeon]
MLLVIDRKGFTPTSNSPTPVCHEYRRSDCGSFCRLQGFGSVPTTLHKNSIRIRIEEGNKWTLRVAIILGSTGPGEMSRLMIYSMLL